MPQNGKPCRAHQGIAAERAALVAVLEAGDRFRREQGGERNAAANALAERHDVGRDISVLIVEELAGAAKAGLDLVQDQEKAMRLRQFAQVTQEPIRSRPYARFA